MPSILASKRNASKSTNLASSPRPYGAFFIAQILEEAMCCLCECELCDDLEDFDCPLWDGVDDWLDLEDDWEAPEWINTL